MNVDLRSILVVSSLFYCSMATADVYKSINEEGNIVYSDTPTEGAETIKPPEISTIDAPRLLKKEEIAAEKESGEEPVKSPTSYTSFSIQQPQDEMTIWDNSGNISVSMKLEPALDVESGHTIWVYLDGKPVVKNGKNPVQPLSGVNRGTHKIRAEIRSGKKSLKQTRTITIYMKQASALN